MFDSVLDVFLSSHLKRTSLRKGGGGEFPKKGKRIRKGGGGGGGEFHEKSDKN